MSGKSSTFDNDLLQLIFNAATIANIAINATSSPLTNLFVALHNADPTASGTQTSSETAYGGYGRVSVARTSGGWTVSGASVSNAANVTFGACSSGTDTITHVSIGTATSGAGKILYVGQLNSSLSVSSGITPQFAIGNLSVSEA